MAKRKKSRKRQYQVYTPSEKRWLLAYARKLRFRPGTRTDDGAWDWIGRKFRAKFGRFVAADRLAFQARTLWKVESLKRRGQKVLQTA